MKRFILRWYNDRLVVNLLATDDWGQAHKTLTYMKARWRVPAHQIWICEATDLHLIR